jgi:hypothetical protein
MSDESKKRGPGRPPIKPMAPILDKKGIVSSASDPQNKLELVYEDPMIFKSLFIFFKNTKSRELHLRCSPTGLTFFARDHSKISRIIAYISGEHLNWYFCESTYWLGINREHVEKIFSSIDKTFFKITIIQTYDDLNSINFIFKDADIDKECNYKIMISSYPVDEELYGAESILSTEEITRAFPIEFTLSAKKFKKTIGDASNYSDTITFEKLGNYPLQITYAKSNLLYTEVYRNSEIINLRSEVLSNSIFRCTVSVTNVKSLANSMVSDDIRILCREEEDILFRSAIDCKALVVNTLVKSL